MSRAAPPGAAPARLLSGLDHEECRLPDLQFEEGDALIKLSNDPKDWLILHKAVLGAASPVLQASFSDAWATRSKLDAIVHPVTGKELSLHTLALKAVDDTYLLEGKDAAEGNDGNVMFQHSSFDAEDWPKLYSQEDFPMTQRSLRLLFALIYGAELTVDDIAGIKETHHFGITNLEDEVIDVISGACAYAKFFGCLEFLEPAVWRILQSSPGFWTAVADVPKCYLLLARNLQNKEVYFDALSHMVAQAHNNGWPEREWELWGEVADSMDCTVDEAYEWFHPQLVALDHKVERLKWSLMELHLHPVEHYRGRRNHILETISYLPFLKFLKGLADDRSEGTKSDERSDFIARSHFTQWILNHLRGEERSSQSGRVKDWEINLRLNLAILKLERAAASRATARVFGPEAPFTLASALGLPRRFNPTGQINRALENLVKEADKVIKDAFAPTNPAPDDARKARAHYDAHKDGYFTYMEVPPLAPWEVEARGAQDVFDQGEDGSLQEDGQCAAEDSHHEPAFDPNQGHDPQPADMDSAVQPVDLTRASKAWLDFLADHCGVARDPEEELDGRSSAGSGAASEDGQEDASSAQQHGDGDRDLTSRTRGTSSKKSGKAETTASNNK